MGESNALVPERRDERSMSGEMVADAVRCGCRLADGRVVKCVIVISSAVFFRRRCPCALAGCKVCDSDFLCRLFSPTLSLCP